MHLGDGTNHNVILPPVQHLSILRLFRFPHYTNFASCLLYGNIVSLSKVLQLSLYAW